MKPWRGLRLGIAGGSILRKVCLVLAAFVVCVPFTFGTAFILRRGPELYFLYRWRAVTPVAPTPGAAPASLMRRLAEAAEAEAAKPLRYDPAYVLIDFPGGDVPSDTGVCTDLVVRSYRVLGWDLQRAVHEDMSAAFDRYPRIWGMDSPDASIDHRRVPNLMVFFRRLGAELPVSSDVTTYEPGDLVAWDLGRGSTHIGIVSTRRGPSGRPLIAHHVDGTPTVDDVLLRWPILAHFRYLPPETATP